MFYNKIDAMMDVTRAITNAATVHAKGMSDSSSAHATAVEEAGNAHATAVREAGHAHGTAVREAGKAHAKAMIDWGSANAAANAAAIKQSFSFISRLCAWPHITWPLAPPLAVASSQGWLRFGAGCEPLGIIWSMAPSRALRKVAGSAGCLHQHLVCSAPTSRLVVICKACME